MKRLLLFPALMLAGCATGTIHSRIPESPAEVANRTVLDEQIRNSVLIAYRAARIVAEFGLDSGRIKGQAATDVMTLRQTAFSLVQRVDEAYHAGNAADYKAAAAEAINVIRQLLTLARPQEKANDQPNHPH